MKRTPALSFALLLSLLWLTLPGYSAPAPYFALCQDKTDTTSGVAIENCVPVPTGATEQISVQATTGALTVTLPAIAQKTQWFCGFDIESGGTTTAAVVVATITGLATGTSYHAYVFPSAGQGVLGVAQPQCTPASGPNVAIVVTVPAGGAGTVATLTAWGTSQ